MSVSIHGDQLIEADEDFTLAVTATSANATPVDPVGVGIILNDDSPPQLDCTSATATPNTLWPPNHKFVTIEIGGVLGLDDEPATITVSAIEQDEPLDSRGDGDTSPDATGIGESVPSVRRERSGTGDGRLYFIHFLANDPQSQATCTGTITVGVPHDQGSGATPIDSGDRFNSVGQP